MALERRIADPNGSWGTLLIVLMGLALTLASYLVHRPFDAAAGYFPGAPFGRDFVNFWLGGRLALDGRTGILSDAVAYGAVVRETFQRAQDDGFLFSYPPSILPALCPFGAMPYGAALVAWTALNAGCFVEACRLAGLRRVGTAAALLSPAFLMTVIYGHFGGIAALAVMTVARRGADRPWRAALLLALLSVKPQLFVVLALLATLAGHWPVVWRSSAVALGLAGLSAAIFGIEPWRAYLGSTLPAHAALFAAFPVAAFRTTVSAYAGVRMAGGPPDIANAVQLATSLGLAALLAIRLRRPDAGPGRDFCFAAGAVALLPYANRYDMAIAVPALVGLLRREALWGAAVWLPPAVAPVTGILSIPLAPAGFLVGTTALLVREVLAAPRRVPARSGRDAALQDRRAVLWNGARRDRTPRGA